MNAHDVYQLVKSLSADEKRIMNDILIQFAGRTKSKLIDLFEELYKLRGWKDNTEQQLRKKLGMDMKKFYQNRFNLGLRMLISFPRLNNGEWNLAKIFEIALQKGHLRDLTKYLMESIQKQVEAENWALAIELQEIAEDFARRHGADQYLDGLEELDDTLVYADAFRQERYFRAGLKRVRSLVQVGGMERLVQAKSFRSEYQKILPRSNYSALLKGSLMSRIHYFEGELERCFSQVNDLIIKINHFEGKHQRELLDEYSFIIPLLLGHGKRADATRLTFNLQMLEISNLSLGKRRDRLEIQNLVSIAHSNYNLPLAELSLEKMTENQDYILGPKLATLYFFTAITFFANGKSRECNKILNDLKNSQIRKRDLPLWQIECLALLSFFDRNDPDLVEYQLKVAKKLANSTEFELPSMICECLEELMKLDHVERKRAIRIMLPDLENRLNDPQQRHALNYLDFISYLRAYQLGMNMNALIENFPIEAPDHISRILLGS